MGSEMCIRDRLSCACCVVHVALCMLRCACCIVHVMLCLLHCACCVQVLTPRNLTLFSSMGLDPAPVRQRAHFTLPLNRPMRSKHPSGSANDRLFKKETSPIFSGRKKMNCYMLPTAPPAEQRAVGKIQLLSEQDYKSHFPTNTLHTL